MKTSRLGRLAAVAAATAVSLVAACGGSQTGKGSLVDQTAAGKNRCVTTGDEHRLFVVEWDGTDSSAFEGIAKRDLVFVRYEGCDMKVVEGCMDDGVQGAYGTYADPAFTSGSVEKVSIKNSDELSTKLPLGVATFGADVASGRALDLQYYVSGTVASRRREVYRDELKANPRCAQATHFVSSYNLGAYKLQADDSLKVGGSASAGGFGASGSHAEATDSLKSSGDLASCTTFAQNKCRAPIRVIVRPIQDGARPDAATTAASGAPPSTDGALASAQTMMDTAKLRFSAEQKLVGGDPNGCLMDLDRAERENPNVATPDVNMLRGRCEMRSGKCEEGKKHYRDARAEWARQMDHTGQTSDASLDADAATMAQSLCPTAAAGGVSPQQQALTLLQAIVMASGSHDTAACVAKGNELLNASAASPNDPVMKQAATGGLRTAAICAGAGGQCDDAKNLWRAFTKNFLGHATDAEVDAGFRANVASCAH